MTRREMTPGFFPIHCLSCEAEIDLPLSYITDKKNRFQCPSCKATFLGPDAIQAEGQRSADETVSAMLESVLANQQAAYLTRGRRFAALTDAEAQAGWEDAFRNWVVQRTESSIRELDDVTAELGLRGLKPDAARVQDECRRLIEEVKATEDDPETHQALTERIAAYRRSCDEAN
jgi:hypothetical protein